MENYIVLQYVHANMYTHIYAYINKCEPILHMYFHMHL